MKLPDRSIQLIARRIGTSPQIIRRLLGELSVGWSEFCSETNALKTQHFKLGLRLEALSGLELAQVIGNEGVVSQALSQYRNTCPIVSKWIWSGGFNPKKLPDDLNKAALTHACRTSGRLRAQVIREIRCG